MKNRLYTLRGWVEGLGEQEQFFTHDEKEVAIHIAKLWYARGWEPFLYSMTVGNNEVKVWYDYRTAKMPKAKVVRRKAA